MNKSWTYEGIKEDLELYIWNGDGIKDENEHNLMNRIRGSVLTSEERKELLSLLYKTIDVYKRREEINTKQYEAKKKEAKIKEANEKKELVTKYKAEWKKHNFLWKVFHRKLNPKKIDFESKDTEHIRESIENVKRR